MIFNFCIKVSYAQLFEPGKGKAVIYFEPSESVIIRLDTALLKQSKLPISLKPGTYVVRAWAPTKELFIDTIIVREHLTTIVSRRLKDAKAYTKYREQLSSYRVKIALVDYVPISVTVVYSLCLAKSYRDNEKLMNQHLENARTAATNYSKLQSGVTSDLFSQQYNSERSYYEAYRTKNNQIVKMASIVGSTQLVASALLFYLSRKIIGPGAYTEDRLLSLNTVNLKSDYPSTCSVGVIFYFNKKR